MEGTRFDVEAEIPWKRLCGLLQAGAVALFFLFSSSLEGASIEELSKPGFNRLLVKWAKGPLSDEARQGNEQIGATVIRNFTEVGWQLVELSLYHGEAKYRALEAVLAVEADSVFLPMLPGKSDVSSSIAAAEIPRSASDVIPNDPFWEFHWNLTRIGAPSAWTIAKGSSNVVVVVIDTGVDYTHEDLASNMWRNPGETGVDDAGRDMSTNGIDDDQNGYVDDIFGIDVVAHDSDPMDEGFVASGVPVTSYHGTACASIIGATSNNGKGVAGINWSVSIMAIRALWFDVDREYNSVKFSAQLVEAFDYVIKMKRRGVNIRVTSNSYGSAHYSEALREAIDLAGKEGIINVFSAGNNGLDNDRITLYPASYNSPSILSVAASTETEEFWAASNFGRSTVHIAAPGLDIATARPPNRYSISFAGTSAACPHVAGALALLVSFQPSASMELLKAAVLRSADTVPALQGRVVTNGRLNLVKSLERLTNAALPAIVLYAQPAGARTRDEKISVTFSKPMNPTSVESAFIISPSEPGQFQWSDDYRSFTFIPSAPILRTNHMVRITGAALDAQGMPMDGNFNGMAEGAGQDDFLWTFGFPVLNDDFVDAQRISGASASAAGTTRNASPESGEPDHGKHPLSATSVWFRWTAPNSGPFQFEVKDASFDALLGIYMGTDFGSLHEVGSNLGTNALNRVRFHAAAGTNYFVAVAGKSMSRDKVFLDARHFGDFLLSWEPGEPAISISSFLPTEGAAGTRVLIRGQNLDRATAVWIGNARAAFSIENADSGAQLVATVPPNAEGGSVRVVSDIGEARSSKEFSILPPDLVIEVIDKHSFVLRWPATTLEIVLENTPELADPAWSLVVDGITRTETNSSVILPTTEKSQFYRLRKAMRSVSE